MTATTPEPVNPHPHEGDPGSLQIVNRPASDSPGRGLVVPADTFASMFRDMAFRRQPRKTQVFPHPFVIGEEAVRRLHRRIENRFAELENATSTVDITVSYSDLSSESFTSWDLCLEEAAETKDAESLAVLWEAVDSCGAIYQVGMKCVTELPLITNRAEGPTPEVARIEISASAPSRVWVDSTLDMVVPQVEGARLSHLFRPLEWFRSPLVREFAAWGCGLLALYLASALIARLTSGAESGATLNSILAHRGLQEQFDAFLRSLYGPEGSLVEGLLGLLVPWMALFAVYLLAKRSLGHVVPRSSINIGMAAKRYKDYLNVFRFVVFGLFVATIVGVVADMIVSVL
jgi:hypothetical protein